MKFFSWRHYKIFECTWNTCFKNTTIANLARVASSVWSKKNFMYFKCFCFNKHKWQQWDSNPQPVCKRTLNHLAKLTKWLSRVVSTYLYRVDKSLQSINWVMSAATGFLPFNQTYTFFKIFSNFVHFGLNFQIFCPFLPFLTFSCPFFVLFIKNRRHALTFYVRPC